MAPYAIALQEVSMSGDARRARATVELRDRNESAQPQRSAGDVWECLRAFVTERVSHATRSSLASFAVTTDLRRHLGRIGEDLALAHLQRLGFDLVARNHRTRHGELDLVVYDGTTLVFVEVKTRRATSSGREPWESLHVRKQRKVRRMAIEFLLEPGRPYTADMRFDAVGVVIDGQGMLVRLDHLEAAF
jgi:putative endonuclease